MNVYKCTLHIALRFTHKTFQYDKTLLANVVNHFIEKTWDVYLFLKIRKTYLYREGNF